MWKISFNFENSFNNSIEFEREWNTRRRLTYYWEQMQNRGVCVYRYADLVIYLLSALLNS